MMSFFIFTEQDFSISAIASTRNDKEKNYARTFFTTFFDPVVLTEIIFRPLYSPVIGEAKCERAIASPLSLYWSDTRFLRRFALSLSHAAYRFLLRTFESCCWGEIVIKERLIWWVSSRLKRGTSGMEKSICRRFLDFGYRLHSKWQIEIILQKRKYHDRHVRRNEYDAFPGSSQHHRE